MNISKAFKRIAAIALIGLLVIYPGSGQAVELIASQAVKNNSPSALFKEQAFTLKLAEMICPFGAFIPVRRWQSHQVMRMADRFGAHRTTRPARRPLIRGEVLPEEFDKAKDQLRKLLPSLGPALDKITRARFAASISLAGSAGLQIRADKPDEWELLVDDRYKTLSQDMRLTFLLMHLAHEAAELSVTPAGEIPSPEINRELIGMIAQGQLYFHMPKLERERLSAQAVAFDAQERHADRFTPLILLYDQLASAEAILAPENRESLIAFLAGYPDLRRQDFTPDIIEKQVMLFSSKKVEPTTEDTKKAELAGGNNQIDKKIEQAFHHATSVSKYLTETYGIKEFEDFSASVKRVSSTDPALQSERVAIKIVYYAAHDFGDLGKPESGHVTIYVDETLSPRASLNQISARLNSEAKSADFAARHIRRALGNLKILTKLSTEGRDAPESPNSVREGVPAQWISQDRQIEKVFEKRGKAYYEVGSYHDVITQSAEISRIPAASAELRGISHLVLRMTHKRRVGDTIDSETYYDAVGFYIHVADTLSPASLVKLLVKEHEFPDSTREDLLHLLSSFAPSDPTSGEIDLSPEIPEPANIESVRGAAREAIASALGIADPGIISFFYRPNQVRLGYKQIGENRPTFDSVGVSARFITLYDIVQAVSEEVKNQIIGPWAGKAAAALMNYSKNWDAARIAADVSNALESAGWKWTTSGLGTFPLLKRFQTLRNASGKSIVHLTQIDSDEGWISSDFQILDQAAYDEYRRLLRQSRPLVQTSARAPAIPLTLEEAKNFVSQLVNKPVVELSGLTGQQAFWVGGRSGTGEELSFIGYSSQISNGLSFLCAVVAAWDPQVGLYVPDIEKKLHAIRQNIVLRGLVNFISVGDTQQWQVQLAADLYRVLGLLSDFVDAPQYGGEVLFVWSHIGAGYDAIEIKKALNNRNEILRAIIKAIATSPGLELFRVKIPDLEALLLNGGENTSTSHRLLNHDHLDPQLAGAA